MEGIVFTNKQKTKLYKLINQFYDNSSYDSYNNFKSVEKRNINIIPILNNLHVLSPTFLTDSTYTELKDFILSEMELNVRTIKANELPKEL